MCFPTEEYLETSDQWWLQLITRRWSKCVALGVENSIIIPTFHEFTFLGWLRFFRWKGSFKRTDLLRISEQIQRWVMAIQSSLLVTGFDTPQVICRWALPSYTQAFHRRVVAKSKIQWSCASKVLPLCSSLFVAKKCKVLTKEVGGSFSSNSPLFFLFVNSTLMRRPGRSSRKRHPDDRPRCQMDAMV